MSSAVAVEYGRAAQLACAALDRAPTKMLVVLPDGTCVAASAGVVSPASGRREAVSGGAVRWEGVHWEGVKVGDADPGLAVAIDGALRGNVSQVETAALGVEGAVHPLSTIDVFPFLAGALQGAALLIRPVQNVTGPSLNGASDPSSSHFILDAVLEGILVHRGEVVLYANPGAVRQLGCASAEELVGLAMREVVGEAEWARMERERKGLLPGDIHGSRRVATFVRKGGPSTTVVRQVAKGGGVGADANADVEYLFFHAEAGGRLGHGSASLLPRQWLRGLVEGVGRDWEGFGQRLRELSVELESDVSDRARAKIRELSCRASQRGGSLAFLGEPETRSQAPHGELTVELLVGRLLEPADGGEAAGGMTGLEEPEREGGQDLSVPNVLVDIEPSLSVVRGSQGMVVAALRRLSRVAFRHRPKGSPLRVYGWRGDGGSGVPSYLLSIGGRRRDEVATDSDTDLATELTQAWQELYSLDEGDEAELLGATTVLHDCGHRLEVQRRKEGGLGFCVELALQGESEEGEMDVVVSGDANERVTMRGAMAGGVMADGQDGRPAPQAVLGDAAGMPHVLICDDEQRLVTLTAGLLEECGFRVVAVRSGEEALRRARECEIDVVVLDVNLPRENPQEVIRGLRKGGDIAVILSSGYAEEDIDAELLGDPSVKAFLAKPYGVDVLVSTIERVRRERKSSGVSREHQ